MSQPLTFALVGCGAIGRFRAEGLARTPGAKLAVVSDIDAARGQAFASEFGARYVADWRAAIAEADAVIVSTHPPLHEPMCVAALGAGKHVLCEKPLARNVEECRRILDAAEQSGRHLATGFNYRHYAAIQTARQILDSGRIGELDHIRSFAGHPGGREFTAPWVYDANTMGGGALVDNGIHILDLTLYFLGQASEVKGYRTSAVWQKGACEDNAFALIKSPKGPVATLQASWTEWRGYRFWIAVYGTRGCVRAMYPPMVAECRWFEKLEDRPHREYFFYPVFQVIERLKSYKYTLRNSIVAELTEFVRVARGEAAARISATGLDGLRATAVAHAAYLSSDSGETVRL